MNSSVGVCINYGLKMTNKYSQLRLFNQGCSTCGKDKLKIAKIRRWCNEHSITLQVFDLNYDWEARIVYDFLTRKNKVVTDTKPTILVNEKDEVLLINDLSGQAIKDFAQWNS